MKEQTHDNILLIEKRKEVKDPWILRTEKDTMKKQTHDKILPASNSNSIESINSEQQESYDVIYKSLVGNNKLPTEGFKSRDHHLKMEYNLPQNRNSASRKQKET